MSDRQPPRELPRPPTEESSDHSLVVRFRLGDQDAATQLYVRYSKRLTSLVKKRCSTELARCAGVEDIVQSVFGTFFRRIGQGCYEPPDGDLVWKVLLVIALNRVRSEATYYFAAKRDAHRTICGPTARNCIELKVKPGGPAPERLELLVQEILERLPSRTRLLLKLRLDGFTIAESARRAQCSSRTAERVIQGLRLLYGELLRTER
jgi:RNA polymerase sigma-70 factor (ECF subfamily)